MYGSCLVSIHDNAVMVSYDSGNGAASTVFGENDIATNWNDAMRWIDEMSIGFVLYSSDVSEFFKNGQFDLVDSGGHHPVMVAK